MRTVNKRQVLFENYLEVQVLYRAIVYLLPEQEIHYLHDADSVAKWKLGNFY